MGIALTPLDARSLLRQFDIRPDKRLGQNFLVDQTALSHVAAAGEVGARDTVLEIGPGVGGLTRRLAAAAGQVVAVEFDARLLPPLRAALAGLDNVQIVQGDILDWRITARAAEPAAAGGASPRELALQPGYKVVANIPYYVTSAIIRHLLESEAKPSLLVLTVQKEVAERICAAPGRMSLLAISVQYYGRPRIVGQIPARAFYPSPKVDSAIVRVDVGAGPAAHAVEADQFFPVVKAGFSQRRKKLKNALAAGLGSESSLVEAALDAAQVDGARRAETLSLEEWARVAQCLRS